MKLISLKLTNFEGIYSLEITPNGHSMSVYGDNGTGKTTIADAQAWLLFDKDSQFTSNFSPKMRDIHGEDIHNVECSVKATYEIDDSGSNVTLEKVLKENWKKKRGSTDAVFSGHNVSYLIDGVPKKEKEYAEYLNSICDIQKLNLLSMPQYFPEIVDIKKRREILMDMVGNISDMDIIHSNEDLKPLLHLTLKPNTTQMWYSIDEYLKICKSKAAEINKELKEIPGRIDELARTLPESNSDVPESNIRDKITLLTTDKTGFQIKINASESEMVSALKTDIANANFELTKLKSKYQESYDKSNADIKEKIRSLTDEKYQRLNDVNNLKIKRSESERKVAELQKMREDTLRDYAKIQSEKWNGNTICPTCGQAIPEEQIQQAKEQFNLHKSQKLEELNNYGKGHCSKEMISNEQNLITELSEDIEKTNAEISKIEESIKSAEHQISSPDPFENTAEYKQMQNKIEGMKAQISMLESSEDGDKSKYKARVAEIDKEISELNIKLAEFETAKKTRLRISELEEKQEQLGQEYADSQKGIYLCELFSRTKADMLTDKINSKFKSVKFRLFKTQINGGIVDDCEVLAKTSTGFMPYSTANNAARISAGLDIIRTFSDYWGVQMPVFVDNAESITQLDTNGLQVIRLVVSESDKVLRFETEE
ncbi:MAG: hypothetical protein ACI4RN_02685 [Oscillospiraceae bacterium]